MVLAMMGIFLVSLPIGVHRYDALAHIQRMQVSEAILQTQTTKVTSFFKQAFFNINVLSQVYHHFSDEEQRLFAQNIATSSHSNQAWNPFVFAQVAQEKAYRKHVLFLSEAPPKQGQYVEYLPSQQISVSSPNQQILQLFQQLQSNKKQVISEPYVNQNQHLIMIAVPLYDAQQKLVGLIGTELDLTHLDNQLKKTALPPESQFFLGTAQLNDAGGIHEQTTFGNSLTANIFPQEVIEKIKNAWQTDSSGKLYEISTETMYYQSLPILFDSMETQFKWIGIYTIPLNEFPIINFLWNPVVFVFSILAFLLFSGSYYFFMHPVLKKFKQILSVIPLSEKIVQHRIRDEFHIALEQIQYLEAEKNQLQAQHLTCVEETTRLKFIFDSANANTMFANNDGIIIYVNQTAVKTFQNAEKDIREVLPHFSAAHIIGANIDTFHKNPNAIRQMIQKLTRTHYGVVRLGNRIFKMIASPVINQKMERIGTAVEWFDQTAELAIQREVKQILGQVVQGDLSLRIDLNNKTEFLKELSSDINSLLETIESGLKDITNGMTHIQLIVSDNAQKAAIVETKAKNTQTLAQTGSEQVSQLTTTMKVINNNAEKINEFLNLMNEISMQTNVLALNASVEAARAGETGRGFSVVADEIRKLASRSDNAAKEIKQLVQNSLVSVHEGDLAVTHAIESIQTITVAVQEMSTHMIALAESAIKETEEILFIQQTVNQLHKIS